VLENCFESGEKILLVETHARIEHQSNL
jgi:hypothetical protein